MAANQKSQRRQATRQTQDNHIPAWVWLFTGAVLGAFIMFLMRLSDVQSNDNKHPNTPDITNKEATEDTKQKPRFDFYDLLKETHIPVSQQEKITKPTDKSVETPQEFLLQVASFKSLVDADRLRAELLLLNLDAQTEKAKIRNGETWHRVIVGPFASRSKLAKARSILLANRYEALVLKRQPQG